MQPYPRAPHLVWPGHLPGTGCLSAWAMDTGFPTVAWPLCLGLGCAWARVSAAPRHSWPGSWVGVFGYGLWFRPSFPGWGLRCLRLDLGFGPFPTILGWGFGACVVACALHLYPASSGSSVLCGCVCLGSGFSCAPPLLGEV